MAILPEGKENEYIEAIKILEEKVENLRRETSSKANRDLETQTSLDPEETELQLPCRICIYVATCEEELSWHMDDEHALNTDMDFQTDFPKHSGQNQEDDVRKDSYVLIISI